MWKNAKKKFSNGQLYWIPIDLLNQTMQMFVDILTYEEKTCNLTDIPYL